MSAFNWSPGGCCCDKDGLFDVYINGRFVDPLLIRTPVLFPAGTGFGSFNSQTIIDWSIEAVRAPSRTVVGYGGQGERVWSMTGTFADLELFDSVSKTRLFSINPWDTAPAGIINGVFYGIPVPELVRDNVVGNHPVLASTALSPWRYDGPEQVSSASGTEAVSVFADGVADQNLWASQRLNQFGQPVSRYSANVLVLKDTGQYATHTGIKWMHANTDTRTNRFGQEVDFYGYTAKPFVRALSIKNWPMAAGVEASYALSLPYLGSETVDIVQRIVIGKAEIGDDGLSMSVEAAIDKSQSLTVEAIFNVGSTGRVDGAPLIVSFDSVPGHWAVMFYYTKYTQSGTSPIRYAGELRIAFWQDGKEIFDRPAHGYPLNSAATTFSWDEWRFHIADSGAVILQERVFSQEPAAANPRGVPQDPNKPFALTIYRDGQRVWQSPLHSGAKIYTSSDHWFYVFIQNILTSEITGGRFVDPGVTIRPQYFLVSHDGNEVMPCGHFHATRDDTIWKAPSNEGYFGPAFGFDVVHKSEEVGDSLPGTIDEIMALRTKYQ